MRTVVHFTDSIAFGGSEQVLLQILAGLDRRHWQSVLFHHPEPGLAPLLEKAQHLQVKLRAVPRMQRIWHIGRLPKFVGALRAERPSILHAHLTWPLSCKYGLLAAVMARVPAVVATAQLYVDLTKKPLLRVQPRLIAAGVDRYLAVSRAVANQLCNDFNIPASKVKLVHNGIPFAHFNRPPDNRLRATLVGTAARPIVLMVGRLNGQKGQRYLIEAAALVPEAMFILAGDGPDRTVLEVQARALGVDSRILFLGYREDIPDLLSAAHVCSALAFEGFLSILEAMAAGKPVIASAIGGNDEVIIHGENGLLVPPADPAALAGAIRRVLSDPSFARRLAKAGRARAYQEFSVEAMVGGVTRVYEELTHTEQGAQNPCIQYKGNPTVVR
jgi:glycosyltransferase involved in cell wall biosynthesis